ncbi:basement membrane-specific heparan sulfate proteoglycan core protein-like [Gambusia affinis]|uniref:basement membrane-specific heparan sulfate proteoglycan core protein-like n=1 Tax=Gambusia affinis TaxID=33528 RepID=UPI001CDD4DE2|nr:basement membrane-specific heparan sulfate proteoglycan core protein-like [Gambusia affinis]
MEAVISFLVLSLLPQIIVSEVPTTTKYRAIVEITSGDSRIFSGESLSLRCIIPDKYKASWDYLWFRGSVQLPQFGEMYQLWNANVKESGKYSCQGKKETALGSIKTLRSLPNEIHVDGGFAILQMAKRRVLIGDALDLKCRLRGSAPVHETILYRDGIEVMVQNGSSLDFHLPHVTLEDEGRYSCRVSWDLSRRTHSVMSVPTLVNILEVLTKPVLEIDKDNAQLERNKMKLVCHVQYNAPAPAPPVNYYFYKNNNLLGPAISLNHMNVRKAAGWYSCRAKVPKLDMVRWSEPQSFGEVAGPPLMPPRPHLRSQMTSRSPPHTFSAPETQPASPKYFASTPSSDQHTESPSPSSPSSESPVSTSLPTSGQLPGQTQTPEPQSVSWGLF